MRAMALFVVAVSLRLGGTLAWAASETAPTPPALESLAAEALARSAELAALRARIRAAEAEATAAGTLPSPMASVTLSSVPVGTAEIDQDPMSGVEVGLSQTLPGGSKLGLRRRMGDQGAAALRFRYQDRRNDLIRQVKWVYYELQYLDEALTIAEQNRDLAKDFLAAAEASYATGKGLQQDVFMAQVRLSGMLDTLVSLRQRRAAAAARLNQLLYRPGGDSVPTLPALERTGIELSGRPLSEIAARSNPALQEAAARVAQAQTGVALAEQGLRPDVTLGFSYRIRKPVPMDPMSGADMWSASASIDLPWVNRRDRVDQEVAAARAEGAAAEHDLEGLRNEVASRIEVLVIELIREDEQIALLETGLLPQAEGALASSRAAYGAGKAEFLTLLDNQANLYNLQLQRSELIAEHERNLAELEYLVGGSLTGEASPEEEGVDPGER